MAEKSQQLQTGAPTEPAAAFKPYIPPDQQPKEFTIKAVVLGGWRVDCHGRTHIGGPGNSK